MPTQNPYGAVPEALTQTRLSLRDIMTDMLMTKKMEQDLSLAKSKAETETAIVAANTERDKLSNAKDMAVMGETSRRNMATEQNASDTLALHQQGQDFVQNVQFPAQMSLQERNLESEIPVRKAHAASLRATTAAAMNEEKRKNEVVSAKDFADRMGAGHWLPMLGIDPNDKRPAYQWGEFKDKVKALETSHPAMALTGYGYHLKSDLENLVSQYHTPGLDTDVKAAQKVQIGKKFNELQALNKMILEIKEPDATKVVSEARKHWSDNPQTQEKYKNFDEFLPDYNASVKKMRSVFIGDLKGIAKEVIDPNYDVVMKSAMNTIKTSTGKTQAAGIEEGAKQLMKKDDLAGAYKYLTDWAKHLQTKRVNPAPLSLSEVEVGASKDLTPLNKDSAADAEKWDRSMRSGLSSLADVAKTFGKSATGAIGAAYYDK